MTISYNEPRHFTVAEGSPLDSEYPHRIAIVRASGEYEAKNRASQSLGKITDAYAPDGTPKFWPHTVPHTSLRGAISYALLVGGSRKERAFYSDIVFVNYADDYEGDIRTVLRSLGLEQFTERKDGLIWLAQTR